ncbi:MAG: hypothetical protein BWX96_00635 [Bacteroidetes bacterium ADurb.Bin145]|jgi:hypothetical protein|nr:MAG: hypothetical protein BWX96_00635 [Bacteroidetes bacterium ADurb.Bin145]
MKKYFYTDGVDKHGPFTFEELRQQKITRETKVWYFGLENWTKLSDLDELKAITNSLPPQLKSNQEIVEKQEEITKEMNIQLSPSKNRKKLKRGALIAFVSILALCIVFFFIKRQNQYNFYQEIKSSAYEADVDFNFYVEKFYRDIAVYGIFPKKPTTSIIKFAKFDHITDATHIHGISCGINDDDKIEIYINPSTWNAFKKPLRYYLIYHELAHDVLNLDDLANSPENEGKLMFPAIATYEAKTMDEFIESSHALFEEVAAKWND